MKLFLATGIALITLITSCGTSRQESETKQWWPKPEKCNTIASGKCTYHCTNVSKPAGVIQAVIPHSTGCSVTQCTKENGQTYKKTHLNSVSCSGLYVITGTPSGFSGGGGYN